MVEHVFIGGKGGVGKTTIASAYGLNAVEAGHEALIVSTDPAHSTSDVFGQDFGDEPSPVDGVDDLWAMEIDPEAEVEAHMNNVLHRLSDQVSPALVNEMSHHVELAHQTPGAFEAALFDRFVAVMRERTDFDVVVFDTSPTGSTLRLLGMPEYLERWTRRLLESRERSVSLHEMAAIGSKEPESTLETDPIVNHLRDRRETFEFAAEALPAATYYLVLNPDDLAIQETRRSIEVLREHDLAVRGLIVNRITPEPDPDEAGPGAAFLRERAARDRRRLEEIKETLEPPVVAEIELYAGEVTGERLRAVADALRVTLPSKPME